MGFTAGQQAYADFFELTENEALVKQLQWDAVENGIGCNSIKEGDFNICYFICTRYNFWEDCSDHPGLSPFSLILLLTQAPLLRLCLQEMLLWMAIYILMTVLLYTLIVIVALHDMSPPVCYEKNLLPDWTSQAERPGWKPFMLVSTIYVLQSWWQSITWSVNMAYASLGLKWRK